jgi:hypothetical protein
LVECERICGPLSLIAISTGIPSASGPSISARSPVLSSPACGWGEQAGVDPVGELFFVEGGGERGLDLAAGLLGRDQRRQPAAGHDVEHGDRDPSWAVALMVGACRPADCRGDQVKFRGVVSAGRVSVSA